MDSDPNKDMVKFQECVLSVGVIAETKERYEIFLDFKRIRDFIYPATRKVCYVII